MSLEIIIRSKDDASEYSINTLIIKVMLENDSFFFFFSNREEEKSTCHNAKGEDVRRFVKFALEMCLWTAPIVIASQHALNAPAFGEVCGIFKVDNLNLFNRHLLAFVVTVDHDIIWLDI
jgi:hypothetical protein